MGKITKTEMVIKSVIVVPVEEGSQRNGLFPRLICPRFPSSDSKSMRPCVYEENRNEEDKEA